MRNDILCTYGRRSLSCKAMMLGALGIAAMACAPIHGGPTDYTKADPVWGTKYGYIDKLIGEDEYSVVVTGNPRTSKERVADIALLRAAHVTKEHDRTHFVILNQVSDDLPTHEIISAPLGGLLVWLPIGEQEMKEPHAVLLIRLLPGDAQRPDNALDAAAVIEEVSSRLEEGHDQ